MLLSVPEGAAFLNMWMGTEDGLRGWKGLMRTCLEYRRI